MLSASLVVQCVTRHTGTSVLQQATPHHTAFAAHADTVAAMLGNLRLPTTAPYIIIIPHLLRTQGISCSLKGMYISTYAA
jgi:hypothetical protein